MTRSDASSRSAQFGVFELDLHTGELRKRGVRIPLQMQPFRILALLVLRRGELVTREELRQKLWPDAVFVDFDHGLNKAIAKIRRALGDLADNPRFIETLERRGYRFIAPVELVVDGGGGARTPVRTTVGRLTWNDRAVVLEPGSQLIGRDPRCDVWVDSSLVSRHHARLIIGPDRVAIQDLGSRNGTFVNGSRIDSERVLVNGDEIRVGPARLVVRIPATTSGTLTEPA